MLVKKCLDGVEIFSVNKSQLIEILEEIASRIKAEHIEVKEIILYGSFSKNNFTAYSDIDIVIVVEHTDKEFLKRQDEFIDYFLKLPFDTNLIIYTCQEIDKMFAKGNNFIKEVKQGIRL